jgi:hypothetical protein
MSAAAGSPCGYSRDVRLDFAAGLFYVEDQSSRQAARITYLPASGVGYVLELQPDTQELLAAIAVAACLIVDNAFVSPGGGGGN